MKKIIALLLTLPLIFGLFGCKSDKDDKESESKASAEMAEVQIISKIKGCDYKIIYDDAHHIQKVTSASEDITLEFEFNDAGHILSKCYVVDENIIANAFERTEHEGRSYEFYYYDAYGNEIDPDTYYFYDNNGHLLYAEGETYCKNYSYNEAGQLIQVETTVGDAEPSIETYTYDTIGNRLYESNTYEYDSKGRVISYIGWWWKGSYEYNPDDTISKMVKIDGYEYEDPNVYEFEFEYETVSVPKDQVAAIEAERQYIYDNICTMFR